MMLAVSPKLTATVMFLVPPVAAFSVIYGRYVKALSKQTQSAVAETIKVAEERLGNIRTVKAFAQDNAEIARYEETTERIRLLGIKEGIATAGYLGAVSFRPFHVC